MLALAAWCAVLPEAPVGAQAPAVTLAWDPISGEGVAGYIVYVGTTSGSYTDQYDAGNRTTFVYSHGSFGTPYYFAVAAYTHDRTVGPRSEEILFLGGNVATAEPLLPRSTARTQQTDASPFAAAPALLCQDHERAMCYAVETVVDLPGRLDALTPTGDGRLFVIHDRRHVRVVAQGVLLPDTALTSAPGTELSGLAFDPAFDRNRYVYVGEVDTGADGSRTLTVRRYREVAGTLAEGAAIVTSLPLAHTGDAPFALDARGRIYISMPGMDASDGGLPYAGMVLRFERDGTVPRESRAASPIVARGFHRPTSLVWNDTTDALWLAGWTVQGGADLAWLPLQTGSSDWPRTPARAGTGSEWQVVSLSGGGRRAARGAHVLAIDAAGSLLQIDPATRTVVDSIDVAPLGRDAASSAFDGGSVYVAVSGADAPTSQIIRLRRQ